jgi:hypothetical protein
MPNLAKSKKERLKMISELVSGSIPTFAGGRRFSGVRLKRKRK